MFLILPMQGEGKTKVKCTLSKFSSMDETVLVMLFWESREWIWDVNGDVCQHPVEQILGWRHIGSYIVDFRRLYFHVTTYRYFEIETPQNRDNHKNEKGGRQKMIEICLTSSSTSVSYQYLPENMKCIS